MGSSVVLGCLGLIVVSTMWELAARTGMVDARFSSAPSRVAETGWNYVRSDLFLTDIKSSGQVFAIGFGLSIAVAIPAGIALGWYTSLGRFFAYVISVGNSSPRVALVPVLILWFGIGPVSKIALVFLISFFPVLISTMGAVRSIDSSLLNVARAANATSIQLFRTVVLPASIPAIVSGIRIGLGLALIGVVVAEFVAASSGVGYRMQAAAIFYDSDLLFAALVIVAATGVVLSLLLEKLEKRFDAWRPDHHS